VLALGLLVSLTGSAAALAAGNDVKLAGPSSVKLGSKFAYRASGFDMSPANFLAVWQAQPSVGCAKTYDREYGRATFVTGERLQSGKSFSLKIKFTATHVGKHYLCAYLINQKTTKTYARAATHWTDHT
jgi:hypothetical protein